MTPVLSYVLTTAAGPVVPDQTVQFTLTVTNLSSVAQPVYLYYDVPQFTTSEGESAGTTFSYNAGNVAAGTTQVVGLDFTVLSGTNAPLRFAHYGGGDRPCQWRFGLLQRDGAIGAGGGA
jgi:hypothetical protein